MKELPDPELDPAHGTRPTSAALAGHFDALFAADPDPWGYRTRWYEQRKRATTLACLPQARYARAFEPACGNGELSAALAERCDLLVASDGSEAALSHARRRLAGRRNVELARATMPAEWPPGRFDLVVVSELGYYLGDADLDQLIDRVAEALHAGGDVIASHWRLPEGDYVRLSDEVHQRIDERLRASRGVTRLVRHEEADFLVEVWSDDPRSVAQREGLRP